MKKITMSFRALGTLNMLETAELPDGSALPTAQRIRDRVFDMDRRMSVFREDSELSGVNRAAGSGVLLPVSADTWQLVKDSVYYAGVTDGAFDITTGPLSRLWGIGKKGEYIPTEEERAKVLPLVNWRDIRLEKKPAAPAEEAAKETQQEPDQLQKSDQLQNPAASDSGETYLLGLARPGQMLDLGGIAKGFAADLAEQMLKETGAESGLIDFGGTVTVFGRWMEIGVQNPFGARGSSVGTLNVENASVVTSGTYERCFFHDGVRYHHILDPRTGMPAATGIAGITLVGHGAEKLDALCTSVILLGLEKGMQLVRQFDARAVVVMEDGSVFHSEGLELVKT